MDGWMVCLRDGWMYLDRPPTPAQLLPACLDACVLIDSFIHLPAASCANYEVCALPGPTDCLADCLVCVCAALRGACGVIH